MPDIAVRVERLGKKYLLRHEQGVKSYKALREVISERIKNSLRFNGKSRSPRRQMEEFWALKDVSLEIPQGQAVGIVGRNGAGKSTLLKLLSRITQPTTGRIEIEGRVASLLEVGTGFHPELTGRENVFLNGSILGMTRAEIHRKFDEIVAFSEVERFLDTPVKRYSSGMYMRLAFAVAAHLEPEILIVDEVLAVGDVQFQKKCLGKMEDVTKGGRTILFVSHNMAAVKALCTRGVLLSQGCVAKVASAADIVTDYLAESATYTGSWQRSEPVPNAEGIFFEEVKILNPAGLTTGHLACTEPFTVELSFYVSRVVDTGQLAIRFTNQDGVVVFTTCSTDEARGFIPIQPGRQIVRVTIPGDFLMPGLYNLQIAAHIPHVKLFDLIDNTLAVCVEEVGSLGTICRDDRWGVITPTFPWKHVEI